MERLRGGLVFKAHRWLYHSALGSRIIQKKKKTQHRTRSASTQGPSWGYLKSRFLTGLSTCGDCSPQNSPKTVPKSQNRPLRYPHEGPFVGTTPAQELTVWPMWSKLGTYETVKARIGFQLEFPNIVSISPSSCGRECNPAPPRASLSPRVNMVQPV